MATEPNSEALRLEKEPQNLAMGVQATLTITMLVAQGIIFTATTTKRKSSVGPGLCVAYGY